MSTGSKLLIAMRATGVAAVVSAAVTGSKLLIAMRATGVVAVVSA
jgi:hypothetical protein